MHFDRYERWVLRCAELSATSVLQADFHHVKDIQTVNDETLAPVVLSTDVHHNDIINERVTDQSVVDQPSEGTLLTCHRFYGGYVQHQSSSVERMHSVKVSAVKKGTDQKGREWSRMEVELVHGGSSVVCKLWRDKSGIDVSIGDTIKLTNMTVSHFRNMVSLDSSRETECEVRRCSCHGWTLQWCQNSHTGTHQLLNIIIHGTFVIAVVVAEKLFSHTLPLCTTLQKVSCDLAECCKFVDCVMQVFTEMRADAKTTFAELNSNSTTDDRFCRW